MHHDGFWLPTPAVVNGQVVNPFWPDCGASDSSISLAELPFIGRKCALGKGFSLWKCWFLAFIFFAQKNTLNA
jgi:hypothetical protein